MHVGGYVEHSPVVEFHIGGIFSMSIKFSEDYPSKPPKVRFTGTMFHPNVYGDGSLCLDIIQEKWSPIYNVNTILISIRVTFVSLDQCLGLHFQFYKICLEFIQLRIQVPIREFFSKSAIFVLSFIVI
eukprot:TRINITY_DN3915_c0_g1_i10.p1 TRINITY_DN3915_c0_g1~~TRINITY_DN3915_c0_g1_i10.p1  ORF type:complete len:128 (-),score=2.19 TRINITY_DN3915_c0_g1_i10:245-628(-)